MIKGGRLVLIVLLPWMCTCNDENLQFDLNKGRKMPGITLGKYLGFNRMGRCNNEILQIELNNGRKMPAIALGTYLGFDRNGVVQSKDKILRDAVIRAIDFGYRHFDTASIYQTEDEVGEAIRSKIEAGKVDREDIFVTTKLWNTHHKKHQVIGALKDSLRKMGLDYVDLYLMHWPIGLNEDNANSDVDFMETWIAMEDVYRLGLAKSIGLSNFNRSQIERVLNEGSVRPAALQIEIHLQMIQKDLVEYAQKENIVVMGYSPLGSLVLRYGYQLPGPTMNEPKLRIIGEKYNKTVPQIVLRWLVERKIVPVVKSTNPKRLQNNIDIFDICLTDEEISQVESFDTGTRYTLPTFWQDHPYYPFEAVENPIENPFLTS